MRIAVAAAAAAFSVASSSRENSCASAFSTIAAAGAAGPRWARGRHMCPQSAQHAACTTPLMSASASGTPATRPVSSAALGLQEELRRLCADKSEPDRETKIEQLANVRFLCNFACFSHAATQNSNPEVGCIQRMLRVRGGGGQPSLTTYSVRFGCFQIIRSRRWTT